MKRPVIYDGRGNVVTTSRQKMGYAPGGYLGAARHRSRSLLPGGLNDSRVDYNPFTRRELQRQSRFFKKNVGMMRGVAKSLRDHAIGPGVYPLPATSNDTWNRLAWNWFWEVAKIGDVSGKMTLWEAQAARTEAKFWDGGIFTAHVASSRGWPQYQLIRAHNCGNFDVDEGDGWRDGVKLNGFNRPLAYRFRLRGEDRYETVPAKSVVHSYLIEDTDQVREIPPIAHAIVNAHDILDALALEKEAMKDNARVSRVIKTESGEDEENHFDEDEDDTDEGAGRVSLEKIFGAEVVRLKRGESLDSYASTRPSPAFMGFIAHLGKDITTGTGFPYEFAWDPNELKGPAVRFVLEKVRLAVAEWRRNEIEDTYPFYTYAIAWAMDNGELPYHPEWFKVEWIGGAPDVTIDKGRDAAQDRENIKAALTTFKRYYAAQGLWWKDELEQKAREAGFIDELAVKYGVKPDRIHLLMLNQAAADQQPKDPTPPDDDEEDEDPEDRTPPRRRN